MSHTPIPVTCLDCGLPYSQFPLDVNLPRAQWLRIHPDERGVLCAACIVKRAAAIPGVTTAHMVLEITPQLLTMPDADAALEVAEGVIFRHAAGASSRTVSELSRIVDELRRYRAEASSGGTTAGCVTKATTDALSSSGATTGSDGEAQDGSTSSARATKAEKDSSSVLPAASPEGRGAAPQEDR